MYPDTANEDANEEKKPELPESGAEATNNNMFMPEMTDRLTQLQDTVNVVSWRTRCTTAPITL